jgi:serine/threonine protein phosphatase PrpC
MQFTSTMSTASAVVDLTVSAASAVGNVRRINEDSFHAATPIYLVADGMGGHRAGDEASQTVAATFAAEFDSPAATTTELVLDAIQESNAAVRRLSGNSPTSISGTTLVGLALVEAYEGASLHWMAFNIGDSRIYSWDGRFLGQLSVDHSAVQELVDAGLITAEQAAVHPERNVVTRAIGAFDAVDADIWLLPVGGSQSFLLCSDGLTKELTDTDIASLLAQHDASEQSIADALVEAALAAGGKDNVTAVFIESLASTSSLPDEDTIGRARRANAHLEDTMPRS